MTVLHWVELGREALSRTLPEAIVLLPTGSVEQHGPHLPTGTDTFLSLEVCERAAELAAASIKRDILMAPAIPIGASDHHLPFGGTISLKPETFFAVLLDVLLSIHAAGARRLLILNGHGGNTGLCNAAAAAAAAHTDLEVAQLDYWLLARHYAPTTGSAPIPGHAGQFETSLMLAVHPELVGARPTREHSPQLKAFQSANLHSAHDWMSLQGFTDSPALASAEQGELWVVGIIEELSERLITYTN